MILTHEQHLWVGQVHVWYNFIDCKYSLSGYKLCLLKSLHIESYFPYCQPTLSLLNFTFLCLKILQAYLVSILFDSSRLSMLSKGWFSLTFGTFPLFWYKHLKSETLVSLLFGVFLNPFIMYWFRSMEQHTLKNVNNYLNTNIFSYLETSGDQSSKLYLNAVHFFQHQH